MKVIGINGSPKKDGNTASVLKAMAEELASAGIETEILHIGAAVKHGCTGCGGCSKTENGLCIYTDDIVNEAALKMREADGIILGSPVYYSGIAGNMKSFLDRAFYTSSGYFKYKVGAAFAVARRTGGSDTFHQLCNYLLFSGMIVPPYQYWGAVYGRTPGEVTADLEGMQTMRYAAKDMAWLLKNLEAGKNIPKPEKDPKISTNFIR
ncbi:MAG: flavodoxin family protein [Clostridiales bacterium]|nr:flavodoxin family protein [Clostridiales bacterium]